MNFAGDYADYDTLGFDPDNIIAPTSAASLFITQPREQVGEIEEKAVDDIQEEAQWQPADADSGAPFMAQTRAFSETPQMVSLTISNGQPFLDLKSARSERTSMPMESKSFVYSKGWSLPDPYPDPETSRPNPYLGRHPEPETEPGPRPEPEIGPDPRPEPETGPGPRPEPEVCPVPGWGTTVDPPSRPEPETKKPPIILPVILEDAKIQEMRTHLQTAISLEQKTIPLYLYAAYSLKSPGPAMWNILRVVSQEMLHMGLAGNILCSIGGYPALYRDPKLQMGEHFIPEYPTSLLYQEIRLNLRAANKGNIRTFMELERPDPMVVPSGQSIVMPSKDLFDDYGSIGAFYHSIAQGLQWLDLRYDNLFIEANVSKQLNSQDGSWYDDDMISVKDVATAMKAIETIVEQGEGSPKVITPEPPKGSLDPPAIAGVRSHFEVFEGLYNGPKLDCYDVLENPKTKDYVGDPMHPVLLASDAVYCYLLLTLEKLWTEGNPQRRRQYITKNLQHLMMDILRPIAKLLVTKVVTTSLNPIDVTKKKHFGPPFNFYDFGLTEPPFKQLKVLMTNAVTAAPELRPVKDTVDGLMDIGPLNPVRPRKS